MQTAIGDVENAQSDVRYIEGQAALPQKMMGSPQAQLRTSASARAHLMGASAITGWMCWVPRDGKHQHGKYQHEMHRMECQRTGVLEDLEFSSTVPSRVTVPALVSVAMRHAHVATCTKISWWR